MRGPGTCEDTAQSQVGHVLLQAHCAHCARRIKHGQTTTANIKQHTIVCLGLEIPPVEGRARLEHHRVPERPRPP
eukprot:7748746-Pyramimonas_sp.AAC.1